MPGIITEKPIETQTQSEFGLGLVTSTSTSTSTTTTTMTMSTVWVWVWVWVCLWVWVAVWFVMRRMWMWQAEFSRFGRMAWAVCNRLDDWVFDFFLLRLISLHSWVFYSANTRWLGIKDSIRCIYDFLNGFTGIYIYSWVYSCIYKSIHNWIWVYSWVYLWGYSWYYTCLFTNVTHIL